jgi:predicted nucleotidyltransferase
MTDISIYQTSQGHIEVRLEQDTVWLSQEQMAALFEVQKAAVSKHLKNIYASGELEREATVSKLESVRQAGQRTVSRQIEHFNLDAVISVGYRVNSTRATRFRQWATGLLLEALAGVKGVEVAVVFGSVARGAQGADSDLDVLVLGSASELKLNAALKPAGRTLGRAVHATVYTIDSFKHQLGRGESFALGIVQAPRIALIGELDAAILQAPGREIQRMHP